MTELQLYLLAGGAVFVAAVFAYNVWQERKARRKAEAAFGERPGDALFDAPPATQRAQERREPTMGDLPQQRPPGLDETMPPIRRGDVGDLEAPVSLGAQISSRIDTDAVILADDPVTSEQLEPLHALADSHETPVHVEGIVDEQWQPVDTAAGGRGGGRRGGGGRAPPPRGPPRPLGRSRQPRAGTRSGSDQVS